MRIAYTIQSLDNSGGIERVVVNKANWLAMHNHEVTIITSTTGRSFYELSDKVKIQSLCLSDESGRKKIGIKALDKISRKIKHVSRLGKILNEINPDVVSSIHSDDFYYLPFINKGSKKVFEYHYVSVEDNKSRQTGIIKVCKNKLFSWLHNKVFDRYNAIVFLSKKEAKIYSEKINVFSIPNTKTFAVERKAALDSCNVIAIGNLIPLKGFDRLLSIWKEINDIYPQWKLNIFGEGKERENLQTKINEMNLEASVYLNGRTNDIKKELLGSSILVSASRSEAFSMVLLEAQSVGVPCVAFDCPFGPSEIVEDEKTGFLVPMDDNTIFVKRLSTLIGDVELRRQQGENAFVNAQRFDEDKIMNQWLKLFNDI